MKRDRTHSFDLVESNKRRAFTNRSMTLKCDPSEDVVHHACKLFRRYESGGIAEDIEEAIRIHRQELDQRGEGHPRRDEFLCDLAESLRARFQTQGVIADLIEATSLLHSALQLRPVGHPKRPWTLGLLASCLALKDESPEVKVINLDEGISILDDALGLCPVGDPSRCWILDDLATCFRLRSDSQRRPEDLRKAISLYQEVLELLSVGHPHRACIMTNLASCLRLKFALLGMSNDLEEAILHFNAALELRPEGHPDRDVSLDNLALALEARFVSQDSVTYLDEAISLHKAALELRPVGSPCRVSSLTNLAICLKRRFDSQGAVADFGDATDILQTLRGPDALGRRNNSRLLSTLASCLEARYHRLCQLPDLEEAMKIRQELLDPPIPCHPRQDAGLLLCIQQVSISVIQDIQKSLPPRLLDTQNGTICDQSMQISRFKNSPQYLELVSSVRIHRSMQREDIEDIRTEASRYFRYATLSHRWGEDEPLLENIAGRSIYDMLTGQAPNVNPPLKIGLMKLQNFCHIAKEHGFRWAWCDTCCIDKNNSIIEIQEAFGSMFSWYRQSGLTIVHLADVRPNATARELSNSEWFRRGWTLQELLASKTLLFYSQDWTLLVAHESSNHKRDGGVLAELERATCIPLQYLADFSPSMDDARLRLQWASYRRTTRPEDTVYSLFGIFNLNLSVQYGEGKGKALGRLLQEIITRSGNTSVLHWSGKPSSYHSCFPASIESYHSALTTEPELLGIMLEQSLSRLRHLVHPEDAYRFYTALTSLPFPHFIGCRLQLPCVVYPVESIQFKKMYIGDYLYEVQASNLRSLIAASSDELPRCSQRKGTPYVLVRVLDQKLFEKYGGVRDEDSLDAAYRAMVELNQPFTALLLERASGRVYRRVASSNTIIALIVDSRRITTSKLSTLNIA